MSAKTILAVDDEAHILHVVSLKLSNAGFKVLTANDAEEALETAAAGPIDLLITDFQMPGMSGLDLARKIHGEPGRKHLPTVLLTAHGLSLEQVDLAHAGIHACLSKPFSPRNLLEKVNEMLDARERTLETAGSSQSATN